MATVMNPQSRHHTNIANHTTIQKVCIGMGVGFILVGSPVL